MKYVRLQECYFYYHYYYYYVNFISANGNINTNMPVNVCLVLTKNLGQLYNDKKQNKTVT